MPWRKAIDCLDFLAQEIISWVNTMLFKRTSNHEGKHTGKKRELSHTPWMVVEQSLLPILGYKVQNPTHIVVISYLNIHVIYTYEDYKGYEDNKNV